MLSQFFSELLNQLQNAKPLEWIGVIAGIASVWFSKKENILVYPVGLINTIIYIFLSAKGALFGEAAVNLYYTIVSIYGWWLWALKKEDNKPQTPIAYSNKKEIVYQLGFFSFYLVSLFSILSLVKKGFAADTIPWADSIASASAFTGMWLMAKKKVESWYWWILTNIFSIPLYFVKHYALTSAYYVILLLLAFSGLMEWRRKAIENIKSST